MTEEQATTIATQPPEQQSSETPAATPLVSLSEFSRIELRVAEILEAEPVPKSKKLLKLSVSLGHDQPPRQVLAGIATSYDPASLIGRRIVIVCNLEPATLMGLRSEGMLLATSQPTGDESGTMRVVLLDPGQTALPGSLVR